MRIRHDYLRELRLRWSKTQSEIAEEAGVDIRTYRKYENGEIGSFSEKSLRASQYEFLRNLAAYYDLKGGPEELLEVEAQRLPIAPIAVALPTSGRFIPIRYVHRPREEARALKRLEQPGRPVVIQSPERFGATRFLGYLLAQAQPIVNGRLLTIRLNLARLLGMVATTGKSLLLLLGEQILEKACGDAALAAQRRQQFLSLPTTERGKLAWLIEQHVLPEAERVYLALEHAEVMAGQIGQAELFAAFRSWAEAADSTPWNRLRLLLTISTEPTLLEHGEHSSFFTVAAPIRLEEFNREQLTEMNALEGKATPSAIEKLIAWIGGNPYLARLAMQAACERELDLAQIFDERDVRQSVFAHYLMSLRSAVESQSGMMEVLSEILQEGGSQPSLAAYCFLYKKGLVIEGQDGKVQLRCRLYLEYFRSIYGKPA